MTRQAIPQHAPEIRALPDADLISFAMLAAVCGISPWKRDMVSDRIVLHEQRGTPIPETMISDLEVPIYISVICIMAATIVLQHMRIQGQQQPAAAKAVS
eukprot:2528881-Rhodomonas_salina.1